MTRRRKCVWILAAGLAIGLPAASLPQEGPYEPFLAALEQIQSRYVEKEKTGTPELLMSAEDGVVSGLDAESLILPSVPGKGEAHPGIQIRVNSSGVWVLNVIDGSPADLAGMNAGDRLLRVDGRSAFGKKRLEIENWLKGKPGTDARIMWISESGEYWERKIARAQPRQPAWRRILLERADVIQVFRLDALAARDIAEALKVASRNSRPGAVLDLRRAVGGEVDAAIELAQRCLGGGALLAISKPVNPLYGREYVSPRDGDILETPLVVLTGRRTQGAAELLAAALRDHRRAVVVGERTFGYVARQRDFSFGADRMLRLTVERFLSPSGASLADGGVTPDLSADLASPGKLGKTARLYGLPELVAERMAAAPPAVFDEEVLAGGTIQLTAEASRDKSVMERQVLIEEAFAIVEEAVLRDLKLEVDRETLARERPLLISRVRVLLAKKRMPAKEAMAIAFSEDAEVRLCLDVLQALGALKGGKT